MALIPIESDVQRANLGALRAPAVSIPAPERSGLEDIGGALDALRGLAEKRLDEAETDEAKDLDNQLADELRTRMNGDGSEENPGYYSTRGTDAIDSHDIVETLNDAGIDRLAESASSDRVRRKFMTAAEARREAELDRMAGHVGTARIDRDNTTSAARQDQAIQDASTYYNDGTLIDQSIGIVRGEAKNDAQRNGLDAEATKVYVDQVESKVHITVLTSMVAKGEDILAQTYFAENSTKITDINARNTLEGQIKEVSTLAESQRVTESLLLESGGDVTAAIKKARATHEGKLEDAIVKRLKARGTEQDDAEKKARTEAYKQAFDITSVPGNSLADVPVNLQSQLTPAQLKGLQSGTIPANVELNGVLNKMLQDLNTGEDDKFLTYDLDQHIGEMPATTIQWWQAQQTAANSNNPNERFTQTRVTSGVVSANKIINSVLAPLLKGKNKVLKETGIVRKAAMEDHMRQFVADWHENNTGNMPSKVLNEEIYSLLVTGTVEEDEFLFGFADDRSDEIIKGQAVGDETFIPDLEDEENLTRMSRATGIPGGVLPDVITILQNAGLPVTLKNLRAALPFIGKQ